MAVTVTNKISATGPVVGSQMFVATVIATADGDTTATCPHGLLSTPLIYGITPLLSQALTALSAWVVSSVTSTNIVLTKLASTGSGNASPQVLVWAMTPNSLIE